jgi:hypothetical protein
VTRAITIILLRCVDVSPHARQRLTWDVHVGTVNVVPRWEVPPFLPIGAHSLLARPRLVTPREKDEEQLVYNVGVGDIEVVLQRREVDPAVDLQGA